MPRLVTGSLLDMDVTTIGRGLVNAWAWWTEQLKAMVPARLQRGDAGGLVASWSAADGSLRITKGGRAIPPTEANGQVAVLAISAGLCLIREVPTPALGEADARRAVLLDLDRLIPFPAGQALVALEVAGAADRTGRSVVLAALPVSTAERILADAAGAGIAPVALALLDEAGKIRFDFLPQLRARRGEPEVHAERRFWWRAVLAAFIANLMLLVVADVRSIGNLAALVETHGALANQVRVKRRQVLEEQGWRQALAVRHQRADPLPLLADLARRLPATATLKRLELAGGRARLLGVAAVGTDVSAPLRRDPYLSDVHATSVDALARTPEGQPFDLTVRLAR